MVNAISASTLVTEAPAAKPTPPPAATASTSSPAAAPDTATISAAGQVASKASQDVDRDGDSH